MGKQQLLVLIRGDGRPAVGARERGQTLVAAAIVLVALVGATALVVDVGNAYAQRRHLQNAADAAAMAAARELAMEQPGNVDATVREYALERNGAQHVVYSVDGSSVTVVVSSTFPTYFAAVVGVPTLSASARAEAGYGYPKAWVGDLVPIAVHKDAVVPDRQVEIWDDEKTASNVPLGVVADGQRGWLNFNGGAVGDSEIRNWVINGWHGRVEAGMWINGTPGTKTAALQDVQGVRLHTIVYVPIYDDVRPGQNGSAFYVTQVVDTGNPKFVKGQFLRHIDPQEIGGTFDSGVRVVVLQR